MFFIEEFYLLFNHKTNVLIQSYVVVVVVKKQMMCVVFVEMKPDEI